MVASDTQVDGIWYDFNPDNQTAIVTYRGSSYGSYSDEYTGCLCIPNSVVFNNITYSVTSIGVYAFRCCSNLISIEISNSVTSIAVGAFAQCSNLTSVEIPNSVTSIGMYAFDLCSSLSTIEIPNGVTSIGEGVFNSCSGLTSIEIPNSVTSIGMWAFSGCSGLTNIKCKATTPPSCSTESFTAVNKTIPIYVPAKSIKAYEEADVWKEFSNIQSIWNVECSITYVDNDDAFLDSEVIVFHLPEAPKFAGFTFLKWTVKASDLTEGITIQAVYTSDSPTSSPSVVVNPANSAQKLIREGNIYILTDDSRTYTLSGQQIK